MATLQDRSHLHRAVSVLEVTVAPEFSGPQLFSWINVRKAKRFNLGPDTLRQ